MPKDRTLFRSGVSRGILGVHKKNEIIQGFSVISIGEALGHGVDIDETTLNQVIEHGNKAEVGLKSRFGHPNMSSEALGTFLGRSKNFRLSDEGDRVLADLHISKTAHNTPSGDLAAYVVSLAEDDPRSFGASIVFDMKLEEQLDDNGEQKLGDDGKPLRPLARVEKLFAADVVDEPAANEKGFFGHKFFGADVKLSAEATAFLNKFLEMPDSVEKAMKFLSRYAVNSYDGQNLDPENGDELIKGEKTMTKEELREKHLNVADEVEKEGFDKGEEIGKASGAETELNRIKEVEAQFIPGHEDLIEKLKFDGKTTGPEAAVQVLAAEKVKLKGVAAQITKDAPKTVPDQAPQEAAEILSGLPVEDRCNKEWEAKPAIRDEFGSLGVYTAWKKAEESGRVKILNGGK